MALKFLDKNGLTYLWGKIQAKLNLKQNTLTFDTTPTANSSNPVTSGGLKTALTTKTAANADNHLNFYYDADGDLCQAD